MNPAILITIGVYVLGAILYSVLVISSVEGDFFAEDLLGCTHECGQGRACTCGEKP